MTTGGIKIKYFSQDKVTFLSGHLGCPNEASVDDVVAFLVNRNIQVIG